MPTIVVILIGLLLSSGALAQLPAGNAICQMRPINGSVNVRQQPSQSAAVVAALADGQATAVIGQFEAPEGVWYQVANGWVASWVVKPASRVLDGYIVVKLQGSPYSGAFDVEVPASAYAGTVCPEVIYGTEGDDTIRAAQGNDVLIGYGGGDLLSGDAGDDVLFGGTGSDFLYGGEGVNTLYGMQGMDRLFSVTNTDWNVVDGFRPHGAATPEQVAVWFGADALTSAFVYTSSFGDLVVTPLYIFWGSAS